MEDSGTAPIAIERVSLVADPRKVDDLCGAFSSLMGPMRAERGCLRCELFRGWSGPNTVLLESFWRSEEELIRHLRSERYKSLLQLIEESTEQPLIEFFLVSQSSDLDMVKEVRRNLA
jgi:quinol monooxygenase YgiN